MSKLTDEQLRTISLVLCKEINNVYMQEYRDDYELSKLQSTLNAVEKEMSELENEDHSLDYDDAMSPYYQGGCQSMEDLMEAQQDVCDLYDMGY